MRCDRTVEILGKGDRPLYRDVSETGLVLPAFASTSDLRRLSNTVSLGSSSSSRTQSPGHGYAFPLSEVLLRTVDPGDQRFPSLLVLSSFPPEASKAAFLECTTTLDCFPLWSDCETRSPFLTITKLAAGDRYSDDGSTRSYRERASGCWFGGRFRPRERIRRNVK